MTEKVTISEIYVSFGCMALQLYILAPMFESNCIYFNILDWSRHVVDILLVATKVSISKLEEAAKIPDPIDCSSTSCPHSGPTQVLDDRQVEGLDWLRPSISTLSIFWQGQTEVYFILFYGILMVFCREVPYCKQFQDLCNAFTIAPLRDLTWDLELRL